MENEKNNRQQRWTGSGYWVKRRENVATGRRGRAHSDEDERDKQRRYARRAVDQGERLYSIHREEDDEPWDAPEGTNEAGFRRRPLQDWPYDRDNPRQQQRARSLYPRSDYASRSAPGSDYMDNYWGERAQSRDFYDRASHAWWNTTGGRHDYTDARQPGGGIPRQPDEDWLDERDYSWDPGFDYEFGTDFDFLNDVDAQSAARSRRNTRAAQQGTWGGFDYGWRGEPYRQQAVYREFWNVPGPYQGAGPQAYQPSDEHIKEAVCERLTAHGWIDPRQVVIDVRQGEVDLSGTVNRREEKYLAEDIASSVAGVTEVHNRLSVNRARTNRG